MHHQLSRSLRMLIAAALLLGALAPVSATTAYAQEEPGFAANLAGNFVNGWNWPDGIPVSLLITGPYGNPLYTAEQFPASGEVYFAPKIRLRAGQSVQLSNGESTVTHTVVFELFTISLLYDQIIGVALPGTQLAVEVSDYANQLTATRLVTAAADGLWTADFSQPGANPGEETTLDFTPYIQAIFIQVPAETFGVYYATSLPAPFFRVFLGTGAGDWVIRGVRWPEATWVNLEIDDPTTPQNPDYTETRRTKVHTQYPYIYRVDFFLDGFQIQPGMIVTMSDGYTAFKQTVVIDLRVTSADAANDVICGYGLPDTETTVEIDTPDDTAVRYVTSDPSGYFCADFSTLDPQNGDYLVLDVLPGMEGDVIQYDDDRDNTVALFTIPGGASDVDGDGLPDLSDPCPADATNSCNPAGSAAAVVGTDGGSLVTENQAVAMQVPPAALPAALTLSITDAGSDYQLTVGDSQAQAVFAVDIEPSGTQFQQPVSLVFQWPDADNNGVVDGANLLESELLIVKDGTVITGRCAVEPGCDRQANTFTFSVTSLSNFVLSAFVGPTIQSFSASSEPSPVGAAVQASALIQDAEAQNSYTVAWDWGDGTQTTETASGPQLSASHVYTQPGVYALALTVDEGEKGAASAVFEYVVVYDPQGGFVTGGGWINSPAGACRFNLCTENTTGKANFGFVSKYQKGANLPSGNTEFNFKAGGLVFRSSAYQWLVVAGAKAMFKGVGTINGAGDYGFLISAVDAALTSSASVDLFRIKIWELSTGVVVYDNQIGAADDALPTTAIGGGSIVIHK